MSETWDMFRGDLARDGHPSVARLNRTSAARLHVAWRTHLNGAVDGTPAVAHGLVIAGSAGGTLAALSSTTGELVWAQSELGPISDSPTIADGRVYTGTLTGRVSAFDLTRGGALWSWTGPPHSAVWASPVAYRDLVIVGVASPYGDSPLVPGRLYGLEAATGHERWTLCTRPGCAPGDGVWSTPAIDERGVAFVGLGNPDDGVLAFDPLTGGRKWMASLYPDANRDLDVGACPVILKINGRELVAQASVEGRFDVLDAATGAIVWSRKLVQGTAVHGLIASPAFDGRSFYVASASPPEALFALDAAGGAERWRHVAGLPIYSAPAVGQGVVVLGTGAVFGDLNAGSLLALSTADGRVLWQYDTRSAVRSGPAIAGDLVVAGDSAGDVFALRPN